MVPVRVVYLLNEASETSIPLEVAATLDGSDIDVEVCSVFEPADNTFGLDVRWLGATTQFDPRAYWRFLRYVRDLEPDVVHVHPNGTGSIVRGLLAPADVAVVTTEHNDHRYFPRGKRVLNGVTNTLNDVLIANSRATRSNLAGWERTLAAATDTPIEVIHNGVNLEAISNARNRSTLPPLPSGPLIGTACRLVEQKRPGRLVRAVPHMDANHDVNVVIAGDGPLRADLEALARRLDVADSVHFLGYLPERGDVHRLMHRLDVFAFPSVYEGFGVALAEAMAAETAVVASDVPVIHEVVGDAGILVETADPGGFGAAITDLLEDEERRRQLARRARDRIATEFPLESTVSAHAELYQYVGGTRP